MKRRRFLGLMGGAAVVAPFVPTLTRAEVAAIAEVSITPLQSYRDEGGAKHFLVPHDEFWESGYVALTERTRELMVSLNGVTWQIQGDIDD